MTDALGNRRLAYSDTRGNRMAAREFNTVGTSTTLTALTTKYAYDPLDELLTVTDARGNDGQDSDDDHPSDSAIQNGVEICTGNGRVVTRQVTEDAIVQRFNRDEPNGRGLKHRLLYVFPGGLGSSSIEPRHVVFSARALSTSDGNTVISRARHVAYSIEDPNGAPLLLSDPPATSSTSDPR